MTRNSEILQTLETDRVPVLPFELEIARTAFQRHIERQQHLGKEQYEAMNQSSETWHDNAPAEAIAQASKTLAESANHTRRILHDSDLYSYEADLEDGITLGSLVTVRYGTSTEPSHFYITGATREATKEVEAALPELEDLTFVTVSSPAGKALLGAKNGESVVFNAPNGRAITLHIDDVHQVAIDLTEHHITS